MANPPPLSPPQSQSFLLLLLITTTAAIVVNSAPDFQELSSTLEALRDHGYILFTNAITTSDLQYQLLTTVSAAAEQDALSFFTLFAPKDEMLFALDMATDAVVYVNTLRYHIVPNHRYALADLQNLSSPFLQTLLPHYAILVGKVLDDSVIYDSGTVGVMVDGVRIATPDLFLGSRIAVHGIDGILLSGLNMNGDPNGGANQSGAFPPVGSPAPELARNIPKEEMFRFDLNKVPPIPTFASNGNIPSQGIHAPGFDRNSFSPAPASTFSWNNPAEGKLTPTPRFDWDSVPVAPVPTSDRNIPAKETLTPTSYFDWDNIPVSPAPIFQGNIPADRTVNEPHIDWHYVPGAPESPVDGNFPVSATPKIFHGQKDKSKSQGKKHQAKHHRKGRRHQRKHREIGDIILGDV